MSGTVRAVTMDLDERDRTGNGERVAIVGAGLAGLVAARTLLHEAPDREVILLDRGRSVGGRLATRRMGDAVLDHGAQFFTVRGDDLASAIEPWLDDGLVYPWCHGFNEHDGYPRYAVRGGMNTLARRLADGLDVRTSVHVTSIEHRSIGSEGGDSPGWSLRVNQRGTSGRDHDAEVIRAGSVIVTAPIPQALSLLDAGRVVLPPDLVEDLRAVDYHRVLALLVTLDGPGAIPEPGGRQLEDGPFSFVADNQQKGISGPVALTLHAAHARSAALWDADDDTVVSELLVDARRWIGDARVEQTRLERWRYAGPSSPFPEPACLVCDDPPLVLAGDAFAGPKFEGAFGSGRAAARLLTLEGARTLPLR